MADFDNVVSARRVPFKTAVGRITPSKRGPTVAAAFVPDTKSDVSWGSHPSAPTSNCRMSMRWPTKLKKVGVQTDTLHSGGFMIANRVTSCRVDGKQWLSRACTGAAGRQRAVRCHFPNEWQNRKKDGKDHSRKGPTCSGRTSKCCGTFCPALLRRGEGAQARRGYSRDPRPDCLQLVIALGVTPDGFPLARR